MPPTRPPRPHAIAEEREIETPIMRATVGFWLAARRPSPIQVKRRNQVIAMTMARPAAMLTTLPTGIGTPPSMKGAENAKGDGNV